MPREHVKIELIENRPSVYLAQSLELHVRLVGQPVRQSPELLRDGADQRHHEGTARLSVDADVRHHGTRLRKLENIDGYLRSVHHTYP
jgi:hypothetical protein